MSDSPNSTAVLSRLFLLGIVILILKMGSDFGRVVLLSRANCMGELVVVVVVVVHCPLVNVFIG